MASKLKQWVCQNLNYDKSIKTAIMIDITKIG